MSDPVACPHISQLEKLRLGLLSEGEACAIEDHILSCDKCFATLDKMIVTDELDQLVGQALGGATAPEEDEAELADIVRRLNAAIRQPVAPPTLVLPVTIGEFQLLSELGRGGMGVVYLANDTRLGRQAAIKVMSPEIVHDQESKERFLREGRALAAIESDHVVKIYRVGEDGGYSYLAMQLLQGQSLHDWLAAGNRPTLQQVVRIGEEIARGLAAAHAKDLVHRDIKPANVWLEPCPPPPGGSGTDDFSYRIKILDFGLAYHVSNEEHLTKTGRVLGTPGYTCPEQVDDEELRACSDLFLLGCVLYRLVVGKVPFPGRTLLANARSLAVHVVAPPHVIRADVPRAISNLIMELLEREPGRRPQSADEVVRRLQNIEPGPTPVRARKWVMPVTLVMLLFVLLLFVGYWLSSIIVNVESKDRERNATRAAEDHATGPLRFKNDFGMEFTLVGKGTAWLGGSGGMAADVKVEIPDDFYLGLYEVTQEEWEKVTGLRPSYFSREGGGYMAVKDISDEDLKRFPVENVSWTQAQLFVKLLNARTKEDGWVYRLPKDAEWEYACRGGPLADRLAARQDFYFDEPTDKLLPEQANVDHAAGLKRTCKVGSYRPNRLGLHDMHGNVWEWYDDVTIAANGQAVINARGGAWSFPAGFSRAMNRALEGPPGFRDSFDGLRVARVRTEQSTPASTASLKTMQDEIVAETAREGLPPRFKNQLGMEFVLVPRGKSWLGGSATKPGTEEVEFADDFYLGVYEVTQEEWQKLTGFNPSTFGRHGRYNAVVKDIPDRTLGRFPVEGLSWDDAHLFVKLLNTVYPKPGWLYRLPRRAEWEYACRGGPMTDRTQSAYDYYFDKPTNELLPGQANVEHGDGLKRPGPVGTYKPNRLGLYDMHGNVYEWFDDGMWYGRCLGSGAFPHNAHAARACNCGVFGFTSSAWDRGLRVALVRADETKETPHSDPIAEGFVPLFNGKDLTGWRVENGILRQWSVEGDAIVARSQGFPSRNWLLTDREFSDFILRLEYMVDFGAGGGVALRAVTGETVEMSNAIRYNQHPVVKLTEWLRPLNSGTTLWVKNSVVPDENAVVSNLPRALGSWQSAEITVRGDRCTTFIAGKKVGDEKLDLGSDATFVPALHRRQGKLGLEAYTGTVRYRRLYVKELSSAENRREVPPPDLTKRRKLAHLVFDDARDGKSFIEKPRGWRGGYNRADHCTDFACEIVGRIMKNPADAWGVSFSNQKVRNHGIRIMLTGDGHIAIRPSYWEPEPKRDPAIGPFRHPALKEGNEFNTLLVVCRKRLLTVYVNKTAVTEPIPLDRDISPGTLALCLETPEADDRAEFRQLTVWDMASEEP